MLSLGGLPDFCRQRQIPSLCSPNHLHVLFHLHTYYIGLQLFILLAPSLGSEFPEVSNFVFFLFLTCASRTELVHFEHTKLMLVEWMHECYEWMSEWTHEKIRKMLLPQMEANKSIKCQWLYIYAEFVHVMVLSKSNWDDKIIIDNAYEEESDIHTINLLYMWHKMVRVLIKSRAGNGFGYDLDLGERFDLWNAQTFWCLLLF